MFRLINTGSVVRISSPICVRRLFSSLFTRTSRQSIGSVLQMGTSILSLLSCFLSGTRISFSGPVLSDHFRTVLHCVSRRLTRRVQLASLSRVIFLGPGCFVHYFGSHVNVSPVRCVLVAEMGHTGRCLRAATGPVGSVSTVYNFSAICCFSHMFGQCANVAPAVCHGTTVQLPSGSQCANAVTSADGSPRSWLVSGALIQFVNCPRTFSPARGGRSPTPLFHRRFTIGRRLHGTLLGCYPLNLNRKCLGG